MVKVHILSTCHNCEGKAFIPVSEEIDAHGQKYMRHKPCPVCEGSGLSSQWVDLFEFLAELEEVKCAHKHVSQTGGFHFTAGEFWDDIKDICNDCGEVLI